MPDASPSHIALRLLIALALVEAVLRLFLATIPPAMLAPEPPLYQPTGMAFRLYMLAATAISFLPLLTAPLLAQAAPRPGDARLGAHVASLLLALIGAAYLWFSGLPGGEVDPVRAYRMQVAVQSLAALLTYVPLLALAAALALRLAAPLARTAALAALLAIILIDVTHTAGLSSLPSGALLLALTALTALALHRTGRLPAAARPWLLALAAAWLLPWLAATLPDAAAALGIQAPAQRLSALAEAVFPGPSANQLMGLPAQLITLGALAGLLFTPPGRTSRILAAALALIVVLGALNALAPAMTPAQALEMLGNGTVGAGQALLATLAWLAQLATPLACALIAGWLWLRGTRLSR